MEPAATTINCECARLKSKRAIAISGFSYRDGSSQQLAGCLRDFRNKPFPVRAKIEYYKNTLTVSHFTRKARNWKLFDFFFIARSCSTMACLTMSKITKCVCGLIMLFYLARDTLEFQQPLEA